VRAFEYRRPRTLAEAAALLEESGADGAPLAGGTDLLVELRNGDRTPAMVVDLKGVVELTPSIELVDGHLRFGANTTLTAVEGSGTVRAGFPALAEAAATVGSVQIRNRATLAGNICHASPAADTPPALLVYGAEVTIAGPDSTRRLPLSEFFLGPGITALGLGELVTGVELPLPSRPSGAAFGRVTRRRGVDLATVNVACQVDAAGHTRMACGAVGPRPFLVSDHSGTLADPGASDAAKAALLRELLSRASPISDVRASRDYREAMLEVLGLRLLRACALQLSAGACWPRSVHPW
jgi:CO/xanthine dehydrogenase FAD-binding subunit